MPDNKYVLVLSSNIIMVLTVFNVKGPNCGILLHCLVKVVLVELFIVYRLMDVQDVLKFNHYRKKVNVMHALITLTTYLITTLASPASRTQS